MNRIDLTTAIVAAAVASLTVLTNPASAIVTFDWATVGNAGNAPYSAPGNFIGSVGYEYRISKTEVTNAQYAEFLNAAAANNQLGLYNSFMGTDPRGGITQSSSSGSFTYATRTNMANKPVNFVSYFDAMRFTNWLHNGQGAGSTETGVYNITDGISETRATNATFFIPTEDEWYKAGYHQPTSQGGDSNGYWQYPTASNSIPTIATANSVGDISNLGTNVVNYDLGADWNGQDGNLTTVGSAGPNSASFYGTFDQGGNVWEWNETLIFVDQHGIRGGSWNNIEFNLRTSNLFTTPGNELNRVGFRVASPVPEPASGALIAMGVPLLLRRKR